MRPVRFLPGVESDLDAAVTWYDEHQSGLGGRFLADFRHTVEKIAGVGQVLRPVVSQFRRIKIGRFPYFIFYRDDGEGFAIVLVIGAARDPGLILKLLGERR